VAASTNTCRVAAVVRKFSSALVCTRWPPRTRAACKASAKPQVLPPSLATKISMSAWARALLAVMRGARRRACHQITTPDHQNSSTLAPTSPSTTAQGQAASPVCSTTAQS